VSECATAAIHAAVLLFSIIHWFLTGRLHAWSEKAEAWVHKRRLVL